MWRTGIYNVASVGHAFSEIPRTFIFTDRQLYKPGETVTFRGIDRTLLTGEYSSYVGRYEIELTDGSWDPTVYDTLSGYTTSNGTFWGSFHIPDDIEPGSYCLSYERDDGSRAKCPIQIQFFERLRFEAKTEIPAITYTRGDDINATVTANYLGGGSLNDCSYESYWTREPEGFYLNGRYENFAFGPHYGYDGRTSLNSEEGVLSAEGKVNLSVKTGDEKIDGLAYSYRLQTTVMDSGNQTVVTKASVVVHPSKFYLGLSKTKKTNGFPKKGETINVDYVVVDPDGQAPVVEALPEASKRKIHVEVMREDWTEVQQVSWDGEINTRYERNWVTEVDKEVPLVASGDPVNISFVPPKAGYYTTRLSTEDSAGNKVITERSFYVTGGSWWWYREDANEISIVADKDLYSVGDTAHLLMQSPLPAGTYMITTEREGIFNQRVINLTESSTVIDVPIEENYVPVMYVTVSSYSTRTAEPSPDFYTQDLGKPAAYFGAVSLYVDTKTRSFNIDVKPGKQSYRPGEKATVKLHATDAYGQALPNAEITLMAVDRGVIDLINYHVNDPVKFFYDPYYYDDCVKGGDTRSLLMDPVTYEVRNLVGGDAEASDEAKFSERKNFDPTAVFLPALVTDSNGDVTVSFDLPDTLTAYRITAVGVKGNDFALTENEISVANPVSVRQVLPQKLRLNDKCDLGVVISNLENIPHSVNVTLNIYEGLERTGIQQSEGEVVKLPGKASVIGSSTKKITVPAEKTQPLMFTVDAQSSGWITLEFVVRSDVVNEKIELPLEIEKPYVWETVTTTGQIDSTKNSDSGSELQKIIIPSDVDDGMGTLTLVLDSSRLGTLSEAVNYLFHYPYGCMEQRSSAILPLTIFGEYIDIFGLNSEVKNPAEVVKTEVASWKKVQHSNGGFPYWPNDARYESIYVSNRIGEIIAIGDANGLDLGSLINKNKLADFIYSEAVDSFDSYKSHNYSYDQYSTAYAFYVASLLGKNVNDNILRELENNSNNDLDTLSFVALTYLNKGNKVKAKAIANGFRKYMKLDTRGVEIISKTRSGFYCYGGFTRGYSEVYALFLKIYTMLDPKDTINQRLLYEMLLQQQAHKGYWQSTAVTSRVLDSINTYIIENKLEDTDFTAEMLLNGNSVVQGNFLGLGAKPVEEKLDFKEDPLASVPRDTESDLTISKDGTGSLYYTVTMRYALPADQQKARDEGICLYTTVTDVKTGKVITDNTLEEGKLYRMNVYITSTRNREFVALRIPVPAGCTIINAALKGANGEEGSSRTSWNEEDYYDEYYDDYYYGYYNWFVSNEEIYEDEVRYFYNSFYRGGDSETFLFRASRKGTYNVPSATAECMYQEEIFGRSDGGVWIIK